MTGTSGPLLAVLLPAEAAGNDLPIVGAGVTQQCAVTSDYAQAGGDPSGGAPASAEGASASYLVTKVIDRTSEASCEQLPTRWTPLQFRVRRLFADRLSYWQHHSYEVHWVTLTSPDLPDMRAIREDYKELRKRIARKYGYEGLEYCSVETAEGNGVLHVCWAIPTGKVRAFFISYEWLSGQWAEIRGAWNVSIKRVQKSGKSRRCLTRYVVNQYAGGQCGIVRTSQSRLGVPLAKMRKALFAAIRASVNRYELMAACKESHRKTFGQDWAVDWGQLMRDWFRDSWRRAWRDLVETGECWFFKRRFVWFCGDLCEV